MHQNQQWVSSLDMLKFYLEHLVIDDERDQINGQEIKNMPHLFLSLS